MSAVWPLALARSPVSHDFPQAGFQRFLFAIDIAWRTASLRSQARPLGPARSQPPTIGFAYGATRAASGGFTKHFLSLETSVKKPMILADTRQWQR